MAGLSLSSQSRAGLGTLREIFEIDHQAAILVAADKGVDLLAEVRARCSSFSFALAPLPLRSRSATADTSPGRKSGEQTTKSTRVPFRGRHCSLMPAARSPGKTHPDVRRIPNRPSLPQHLSTDTLVLPCK